MSVSVCLSVCVCVFVCPRSYLRNYTSDLHQIVCACYPWPWLGPPPAALRYVIYFRFYGGLHVCTLAKVARRRRPAEAQCTRSFGLGCKLCTVIPVTGQRTHGTTCRELKVTSQVATPGAESAVYDCLVVKCCRHLPPWLLPGYGAAGAAGRFAGATDSQSNNWKK